MNRINLRIASILIVLVTVLLFVPSTLQRMQIEELRDYNECSYVCNAYQIKYGFQLGKDIFSHQPPLIFSLLSYSIDLFENNFFSTRVPSFIASILLLFAIFQLTLRFFNLNTALISLFVAMCFSPTINTSGVVEGNIISVCLSTFAILLIARPKRIEGKYLKINLFFSGFLFLCACFCKLLVAPLFPLFIFIFYKIKKEYSLEQLRISVFAFMLGSLIAIAVGLKGVNISGIIHDSVVYQMNSMANTNTVNIIELFFEIFKENLALVILFLAGTFYLFKHRTKGRLINQLLRIWLVCVFIFLIFHQPLFPHHLSLLIPPFAIVTAVFLERNLLRSKSNSTFGMIFVFLILVSGGVKFVENSIVQSQKTTLELIDIINANTNPGDEIVSDRQNVPMILGRTTHPNLCDISFVRVDRGYLNPQDMIKQSKNAKMIVFWDGRLQRIDPYVDWVRINYKLLKSFKRRNDVIREIYIK